MFKLQWIVFTLKDRLWLRPALLSLLALLTPALAFFVQPFVPDWVSLKLGAEAVSQILNILASSLLAVTTFSLGVMVSAYAAAAAQVTPRANRLLLADSTSQNTLATFIGGFLFSLVSIIALKTGVYTAQGQVILFGVTLLVVGIIVVTMVRWVDFLARFGRVDNTITRVEDATRAALIAYRDDPYLGGSEGRYAETAPKGLRAVHAASVGYIQTINMERLNRVAEETGQKVHVNTRPGAFVTQADALVYIAKDCDTEVVDKVAAAFFIDRQRNFEQDPRFGLSVLAEIAARALSPGLNDTGTAIDIIGRQVRTLLSLNSSEKEAAQMPDYPEVLVPPLSVDDLFHDCFTGIGRDGAGLVEIQMRLQKAFLSLAKCNGALFGDAAVNQSKAALERAKLEMDYPRDVETVSEIAEEVHSAAH